MEHLRPVSGESSPPKSAVAWHRHYSKQQSSRCLSSVVPQVTGHGPFGPSISDNATYQRQPHGNMSKPAASMCSVQLPNQQSHLQQLNISLQQASNVSSLQQPGCSSSKQQMQAGLTHSLGLAEIGEQLQQTNGSLASLLKRHQQLEAQRFNIRPPSSQQDQAGGASMSSHDQINHTLAASPEADDSMSCPETDGSIAVAVSPQQQLDVVQPSQSKLQALQDHVAQGNRASALLGVSGVSSSGNSSTDQPLTPALAQHAGQQQTQVAAAAQQVVISGIKQLLSVAQSGQNPCQMQYLPGSHAAGVEPCVQGLDAFFQQHPDLQDASALQQLLQLNKQLKQDLFAKNQSLNHALQALHQQTHTPADKKTGALQQQVRQLQEQLLARDAALASAEENNKQLRGELGIPQSGDREYLSPCKLIKGPASGSCTTTSPNIIRRLTFDGADVAYDSMCSNGLDSSSAESGPQQQQQQQQQGVSANMIKQLAASYRSALDAKDLQLQQLQRQLEDLQLKHQSSLPAHPSSSSAAVQQQLLKLAAPRTLEEAVQQIALLKDSNCRRWQQVLDQEQQGSRRAAEREAAFKRQLEVEKQQHECTREHCKLITCQLEDLQEKVAKSRAQEMHLQQQLEQVQEKLEQATAAAGVDNVRSRSEVELIRQLQQHINSQKQQVAGLQSNMRSLHHLIEDAGRLVVAAACRQPVPQSQDLIMHLQLEASIKQLLVEASRPAGGRSTAPALGNDASDVATDSMASCIQHTHQDQQQQVYLQQLRQRLEKLGQENDELRQQVKALVAYKDSCNSQKQETAGHLQDLEQAVLDLMQGREQLQRELAETHAQLDKVLQEQQLGAAHLEQCRQQLAEARQHVAEYEAEQDILKDRIRQLADRASAPETSRKIIFDSASAAEPQLLQLSQECSVLSQQVQLLRQQLGSGQAKEEKLQVMNAQLQERNAQLQEQISKLLVGARDAATLQTEHSQQQVAKSQQQQTIQQQQQHLQELQQQLKQHEQELDSNQHLLHHQEQQVQQLQQQLQQKDQQLQETQRQLLEQQQQQLDFAGDADESGEVEQLKVELEQRTKELLEWQTHADALEEDLADLREREDITNSLQEQLAQQRRHIAGLEADKQQLQQELEQTKGKVSHLEFDLHDAAKTHSALLTRFEAVTTELSGMKEGAAHMRLRLDHFTGPAGPQARILQLEAVIQSFQRKYEAADTRTAEAVAQLSELQSKLSGAEDEILALEGQVSILESELAKHARQGLSSIS